jgi:hypothetical protein
VGFVDSIRSVKDDSRYKDIPDNKDIPDIKEFDKVWDQL